ncbi:MAG: ABC transporter substrate-binding protein [Fibrobacterales bacterium]
MFILRKPTIFGLLFGVLIISLCSCSTQDEKTPRAKDTSTTQKASPAQPRDTNKIYLGVLAAKTGDASKGNRHVFPSVQYAIDEINRSGGIRGKQIEAIEYDNESSSLGSKNVAKQAVKDNVIAVIGPARSSFAIATAEVLQQAGIPMITPTATNPKVTLVGDYIFRIPFLDTYQGEVIAKFSYNDLKARTAVILVNANRIYSIELAKYYKRQFEKFGGTVLLSYDYLDTETDYKKFLTKIKSLNPDVVFIPSESRDVGFIMKQALGVGLKCDFVGTDSWGEDIFVFSGDMKYRGFYTSLWHKEYSASKNFLTAYETKMGELNHSMVPLTYDAVMVLKNAIERAHSFDRVAIKESLAKTKGYKGVSGVLTFDKNGDPIDKGIPILQLQKPPKFVKYVQ